MQIDFSSGSIASYIVELYTAELPCE